MPIVLLVLLSPALGFPGCDVGIESEQQGTSSCYDEAVWLQVPRGSHEEKPAERWGDSFVWLARPGGYKDWLSKLREKGSANVVSLLQRDQQGLQVFVMSLVGLMSLACFGMITFMVNTVISHVDGPSESRSGTPQSRLAAVAQSGALPSFCPQHMGHHNEPLRVELAAIEVQANWTLEIRHPNSKKAVFRAKMQRGGQNVEGVLARRRSFVQLFSSGITGEHLLGSVTSLHEIFFPSGVKFGQLFQREDSHLLYYDGGLPSRWSVGLEDAGLLSVVWLPMPGQGGRSGSKSTFREMINDGMEKLGGRHHAHSRHGRTVATMELQLTEDRGARLDIVTLSGTDSVLVVLCTLGLIAFDGIFNLVDSQQFLEERTGLGWVSVMHAGKTAGPLSPHSSRLSPHGAPKAFPRSPSASAGDGSNQQCSPCAPG